MRTTPQFSYTHEMIMNQEGGRLGARGYTDGQYLYIIPNSRLDFLAGFLQVFLPAPSSVYHQS